MSNQNSQDQLINFAVKELHKVLNDLKQGKEPNMSPAIQKLSLELETAKEKKAKMSESEIKEWAERIVKEVSNLGE